MKWLLAASVLLFQMESVIAGPCRPLEYAEIKDTPTEGLVKTYCQYGRLARRYGESAHKMNQLVIENMQKGMPSSSSEIVSENKAVDEWNASVSECYEQQMKINSALKNRSEPEPNCEAPDTRK